MMSWKDFAFWLVTWIITIFCMSIVGVPAGFVSYENLGILDDGTPKIVIAFVIGFLFALLVANIIQPLLKKMFGYKTGLDTK